MSAIQTAAACLAWALSVCQSGWAAGPVQAPPAASASGPEVWSSMFESRVVMGETDSRVSVREIALDDIRKQAASAVGSVIENISVLKDGQLHEQTKMVTVALVRLDRIQEAVAVDGSGAISVVVSARATVDQSELKRRAKALQEDSTKASELARLQLENARLRGELSQVRTSLKTQTGDEVVLADRERRLTMAIRTNEEQVSEVFMPGKLIAMAQEDSQRIGKVFSDIDNGVILPILKSRTWANVVSTSHDGQKLTLGVRIGWGVNLTKVKNALSRYVKVRSGGTPSAAYIVATVGDNALDSESNAISRRVLKYLASNKVNLIVSVGEKRVSIPVMQPIKPDAFGEDRCEWPSESEGADRSDVCIYSVSPDSGKVIGMSNESDHVNPVSMTVPISVANSAVSVATAWEWIDSNGNTQTTKPIVAQAR